MWFEPHNVFFALIYMYMYLINLVVDSQPMPFIGKRQPSMDLTTSKPKDKAFSQDFTWWGMVKSCALSLRNLLAAYIWLL